MRALALTLALGSLLVGLVGVAAAEPRRRFHVVTDALLARLAPEVRRNLAAVGQYTGGGELAGTAFLVSDRGPDGTALALTNHHVAVGGPLARLLGRRDTLRFRGAEPVPVLGVVASDPRLDYALVRVALPASLRLSPLRLAGRPLDARERVYVAGYPGLQLWSHDRQRVIAGQARERALVEENARDPRCPGLQLISVGRELGNGQVLPPSILPLLRRSRPAPSHEVSALLWSGGSGSPIVSAASHQVVALAHSIDLRSTRELLRVVGLGLLGRADPQAYFSRGTPAVAILADLAAKVGRGELPAAVVAELRRE